MVETKPFFSIITAVFNNADGLKRSIDSVINQNFSEYELIVIDGGSSDGTQEVMNHYKDHLSYMVSEKDSGIYNAWNKGLKQARGSWICFLGSDDIFYPDALDKYYRFINQNDGVRFVSSKVDLTRNHDVFRTIGRPWSWPQFSTYMTIAHVGSMHHNSLFAKYGVFDETYKLAGDYEFLLRPKDSLVAGYLPEITVQMEYGGVSNSSMRIFKEVLRAKTQTGGKSLWKAVLEDWMVKIKFQFRVILGK